MKDRHITSIFFFSMCVLAVLLGFVTYRLDTISKQPKEQPIVESVEVVEVETKTIVLEYAPSPNPSFAITDEVTSEVFDGYVDIPKQPVLDIPLDEDTQAMIYEKCEKYNLDYCLVIGLISVESNFNPNCYSSTDDFGLMQINKCNHTWLTEQLGVTDFYDLESNIECGCYMLHDIFGRWEDVSMVLMVYNMGENNARKNWNVGRYSTDYSRAVMSAQEKYMEELEGKR